MRGASVAFSSTACAIKYQERQIPGLIPFAGEPLSKWLVNHPMGKVMLFDLTIAALSSALMKMEMGLSQPVHQKPVVHCAVHRKCALQAKDPAESRGVFVDEAECIGCKACVWCASATFRCAAAEPCPTLPPADRQEDCLIQPIEGC